MLGQLHTLVLGPVTPAVGLAFAGLGCLLGTILAARARRCTGWRRVRLVAYATVAVGAAGIWQPALVGVLGLRVDGSVLRMDPVRLSQSLGMAVGAAALALALVCSGRAPGHRDVTRVPRLVGAGLVLAAGVIGCAHLMAQALNTGGQIGYQRPLIVAVAGLAIVTAGWLAMALGATPSLRAAVGGAVLLGAALTAVHAGVAEALQVRPGAAGPIPANDVTGLSPMMIGAPAVALGGFVVAMLWYFSIGTATRQDLRSAFRSGDDADQIEPWMIEQVQTRVALSSTAMPTAAGWAPYTWQQSTVPVRSIPFPGTAVASALAGVGRVPRPTPVTPNGGPPPMWPPAAPADPARPADRAWRPVPGWGEHAEPANRSRLQPSGTDGDWAEQAVRSRPATRRDRTPSPWAASNPPARPANTRQGPLPRRSTASRLAPVGGEKGAGTAPAARRNARP